MKPFISAFLLIIILAGCHQKEKQAENKSVHYVTDTSFNSSCPYLTKDDKEKPVLSWVQETAGGNTLVYFARYQDSIGQFGKPTAIPTSSGVMTHGENLPKLIFTKEGRALLLFGVKNPQPDNLYTGVIRYSWSPDGGRHWKPAQLLVTDTMQSYDQRYFDAALLPGDSIGISWLNNSRPQGSVLYFAKIDMNKGNYEKKVIATHTCQCCRTALLADKEGGIHVAWRNIFPGEIRDMAYSHSINSGNTFSSPVRISADNWKLNGCPHTGPAMVKNKSGLHVAWYTGGRAAGVYYCRLLKGKGKFSTREAVSLLPSARHPQMDKMPNDNIVIVWDEGAKKGKDFYQRIGMQLRGPEGKEISTAFPTGRTMSATFPQIKVLNNQKAILAYTGARGDKQTVCYKTIRL